MGSDLTRITIETTIRNALKNSAGSPDRCVRNLIDLGLHFSKGRFQKKVFTIAQKMMSRTDSAYYTLLQDLLANTDSDRLLTFGINLGYNGCTRGARKIREIEAREHFDIPWALTLAIDCDYLEQHEDVYHSVIREGKALGIYNYFIVPDGNPLAMLPLLQEHRDCAFILMLAGEQVTDTLIEQCQEIKNVLFSIRLDKKSASVCAALRRGHLLYAVHRGYSEKDLEAVTAGQWLEKALPLYPTFIFLFPKPHCPTDVRQKIYQYILSVRTGQEYPVIPMEFYEDQLQIDRIISDDGCSVMFDAHGNIYTNSGIRTGDHFNLFQNKLKDILKHL